MARYGIGTAWPGAWTTLVINVVGCFAMGCLMVTELHRTTQLFLGTGVLGGFTTFSAYTGDFQHLVTTAPVAGIAYLAGTLVAALAAVTTGATLTRRLTR
ncbi:CrcB protein [Actinokineospora auranticolor]|uniref:Fluoride-specific ion channel FluC n=1 Tax=Actinokineospora auranticolor TaxID=155976 RepID=A0A2S6GMD4_9PSEU|nr:CrcB protein [Actinokineospora auranticolor]